MIQQFHLWVFIWRKEKHCLRITYVPPWSLKYYLHKTRYGKNLTVHWWIIRLKKCGLYTKQNIQFLHFYVSLRISKFLQLAPQDQSIVKLIFQFSWVQFRCSVMSDSSRLHRLQHARPPCPSPTPRVYSNSMSIESVMPPNHLILCYPLLLPPSIFPSIRVFSNESALCIRWPKYWSFSLSISPSNEYSGLISFRMDWLDLLLK